eukprot:sb/3465120/
MTDQVQDNKCKRSVNIVIPSIGANRDIIFIIYIVYYIDFYPFSNQIKSNHKTTYYYLEPVGVNKKIYTMALISEGGTSSPDLPIFLVLLSTCIASTILNSIVICRNFSKPPSTARMLYLALAITDFVTNLLLPLNFGIKTIQPRESEFVSQINEGSFNDSYINWGYRNPSTLERYSGVLIWVVAYAPCVITGCLSLTRYIQIKHPFTHISTRGVFIVMLTCILYKLVINWELLRYKGDKDTGYYYVIAQNVFVTAYDTSSNATTCENSTTYGYLFGLDLCSIIAVYMVGNAVVIVFQLIGLTASTLTVMELLKMYMKPALSENQTKSLKGSIKVLLFNLGSFITFLSMVNKAIVSHQVLESRDDHVPPYIVGSVLFYAIISPVLCSLLNPVIYLVLTRRVKVSNRISTTQNSAV